jgi:murein DD-endopeptidase MepM/ murein hydrolase activator NlpD
LLYRLDPSRRIRREASIAFAAGLLAGSIGAATMAGAHTDGAGISSGGVSAPGDPQVEDVVCVAQCVSGHKATPGATVTVKGSFLDFAARVVFPGSAGNVRATYSYRSADRVKAVVPEGAVTGKPFVVDTRGIRSNRSPVTLEVLPVTAIPTTVFPVRGPHDFGGASARFGTARDGHIHQGQDVFATCGMKLVSVMAGKVQFRGYQGAAGNYVVIDNAGTNTDFGYMHLLQPALIKPGQSVGAGQLIGNVGQTGNARGCHLHFEYWIGNWHGGGHPVDPLSYLKAWDRTS